MTPILLVAPTLLTRPSIGQNTSCTWSDGTEEGRGIVDQFVGNQSVDAASFFNNSNFRSSKIRMLVKHVKQETLEP